MERSQKIDLEEFYATTDISNFEKLKEELGYWQFFPEFVTYAKKAL